METVKSMFDTIKGWFYTCSLIVLLLNLYTDILPSFLLTVATYATFVAFIWDVIVTVIGVIGSFVEWEWTFTGIVSIILNIATLVCAILLWIFPEKFFEIFGIAKTLKGEFALQWLATCIVFYHFALEIVSLPIDLISLFVDEGDFD